MRIRALFAACVIQLCITLCAASCATAFPRNNETKKSAPLQKTLNILHVPDDVFVKSIENARDYKQSDNTVCGVVPHHIVAAELIAGFFKSIKNTEYDTVIIIAPDHSGGYGQAVISRLGWSVGNGVTECDTELLSKITAIKDLDFVTDDNRLQSDHSASNLIPYIQHYLPKAKIVPILLTNRIEKTEAERFADKLYKTVSGKKCLVIFSIDFSHYLTPPDAQRHDKVTRQAIMSNNLLKISNMSNNYLDCPPALEIFLSYAKAAGGKLQILDNSDASKLINLNGGQTTSYFIIRADK